MVLEEIDMTRSEEGTPSSLHPVTTTTARCKIESASESVAPATAAAIADNNNRDVDEGLKPTKTGGKGLWSLWTRNFKSPLLMLLDLVDNAVDAAMHRKKNTFTGRIQIYRDLYEVMPEQTYTTGLCIRNNSMRKIAPLKEVLQLFISAKVDLGSDSIGENGVGLKQSCAALGDLSFVLVKNGENKFELGILAKALQKEDMVILPCFEFEEGCDGQTIGGQMLGIFTRPQYKEVADCIAEYGRIRAGGTPSLARGVARLSKHFEDINSNFFDNPYVFEVIIDKVMHRGNSVDIDGNNVAVRDIINELQHEIPRRYLHIPDDSFIFSVGKKELTFKYWSERLVEFTKIGIPVRSEVPWSEDFGEMTQDSYELRIYLGFDRYRISDPQSGMRNQKSLSLYIYSRASGRLVQYERDARTLLGLTFGGTEYCQALTVIVDDIEGHLPLDPTKQGIAFGNQANGHIHEENLYSVVNCVVKFYYKYHLNKFGGKKALLSAKIGEFIDSEIPENLKTCSNSELTDYGVLFNMTKDNRIQVDRTSNEEEIIGPDTMFRLLPGAHNGRKPAKGKAPTKKVKNPPTKKQQAEKVSKSSSNRKQPITKTSKLSAKKKNPINEANKPPARKKRPITEASKPPARKKQPKTEASKSPARKKRPITKTSKLPARKNQPIIEASKQPAKKKQQISKASKPTAKRKERAVRVEKLKTEKKQRSAMVTQLRPKMVGIRSSSRQSRGRPPERYGREDSDSDSDPSSDEGDEGDEDNKNGNTKKVKIETVQNVSEINEDPIDLCSSSDEEDEGAPYQASISSNLPFTTGVGVTEIVNDEVINEGGPVHADMISTNSPVNENATNVVDETEINNANREDGVMNEGDPVHADMISSNSQVDENASNMVDETEINNVNGEDGVTNEGDPVHADMISSNSQVNENATNEASENEINNVNGEDEVINEGGPVHADMIPSTSVNENAPNEAGETEINNANREDGVMNVGDPVHADMISSTSPFNENAPNEADETEINNVNGEDEVINEGGSVHADMISSASPFNENAPNEANETGMNNVNGENEVINEVGLVHAHMISSNSQVNENATYEANETEKVNAAWEGNDAKPPLVEIGELKSENDELKERLATLETKNDSLEKENKNLRDELESRNSC